MREDQKPYQIILTMVKKQNEIEGLGHLGDHSSGKSDFRGEREEGEA